PFAASRALYAQFGFAPCEPFARYSEHPFSHFMTLSPLG
ncbi:MAG: GNAT family N-acetyltransferase, partial [Pseudomonadota bacterium]